MQSPIVARVIPFYLNILKCYIGPYPLDMNVNYITTIAVLAAIAAVVFIPGNVLAANPNTDNPSGWGKLTSGAASTDGKAFGEHASTPPAVDLTPDRPGRAGIGNINPILTGDPDSSKHPSELGQSLCTAFPGTFPCP